MLRSGLLVGPFTKVCGVGKAARGSVVLGVRKPGWCDPLLAKGAAVSRNWKERALWVRPFTEMTFHGKTVLA